MGPEVYENSSSQFCCEIKTGLINKVYLENLLQQEKKEESFNNYIQ